MQPSLQQSTVPNTGFPSTSRARNRRCTPITPEDPSSDTSAPSLREPSFDAARGTRDAKAPRVPVRGRIPAHGPVKWCETSAIAARRPPVCATVPPVAAAAFPAVHAVSGRQTIKRLLRTWIKRVTSTWWRANMDALVRIFSPFSQTSATVAMPSMRRMISSPGSAGAASKRQRKRCSAASKLALAPNCQAFCARRRGRHCARHLRLV